MPGKIGNTPTSWAKRYRATSPSQNTGAEMNARAVIIVVRSSSERLLTAEMIPTGIAIASQMITAPMTSMTVAGRSEMITSFTSAFDW